eukprot:TRINITY_DN4514_c0_g1_i1.p1 TRINITY_DN4514_c0_g1~~TRINITY_DN4514_c0_g1_i1.p1  ORF type:complete len:636 (-),score=118.31 TRINITY_DN4514_c0_g1_i1:32-1909(-)
MCIRDRHGIIEMEGKMSKESNGSNFASATEKFIQIVQILRKDSDVTKYSRVPAFILELFSIVPDLESIPKRIRPQAFLQSFVKEAAPGDVVVHESDTPDSFYVVLEGVLLRAPAGSNLNLKDIVSRWEKAKQEGSVPGAKRNAHGADSQGKSPKRLSVFQPRSLYNTGSVFGECELLNQTKWNSATVVALEKCLLLGFNHQKIDELLKEASSKSDVQELHAFITRIFPDFQLLSSMYQRKILDSFRPVVFVPGQAMINEGEIGTVAYLIQEGECSIQSNRSPLVALEEKNAPKIDTFIRTKRGFLSNTVNSFKFGIVHSYQWVGAERLLKKIEEPFDYSVVALTKVKAYAVEKQEAKKFPPEIKDRLLDTLKEHYQLMEQRTRLIVQSTKLVAKMDPSHENYDDHLAELKKKYPSASRQVLSNLRKKQFLAQGVNETAKKMEEMIKRNGLKKEMMSTTAAFPVIKGKHIKTFSGEEFTPFTEVKVDKSSFLGSRSPTTFESYDTLTKYSTKSKMKEALSAPNMAYSNNLMQILGKAKNKSRISRLGNLGLSTVVNQMKSAANLEKTIAANMISKSLNKFSIGERTIELCDDSSTRRPFSPTPFFLMKTQYNSCLLYTSPSPRDRG